MNLAAKIIFLGLLCVPTAYIFIVLFGKLVEEFEKKSNKTRANRRIQ